MDLELLTTLAIIHTLALMSPGPDFALTVKIATQASRRSALSAAFGISTGILILTSLSLTGVSVMIHSSHLLFSLVQSIAALYLAYLGIQSIKSGMKNITSPSPSTLAMGSNNNISPVNAFNQGLLTNILNPKALIFFITLFSTLITPDIGLSTQLSSIILLFSLSLAWFCALSLFLSKPIIQKKLSHITPYINLVTGLLFMLVAIGIITELILHIK